MKEADEQKAKNFLRELSELSRKYEMEISACGCCNGPTVWPLKTKEGHYKMDYPEGYKSPRDDGVFEFLEWNPEAEDVYIKSI